MSLLVAADSAGILDRAVEILVDMADNPTRQMQAGERWLRDGWLRTSMSFWRRRR
jgi:23S rRNA C2498 (ribose-2'-O)-methylase RlmM